MIYSGWLISTSQSDQNWRVETDVCQSSRGWGKLSQSTILDYFMIRKS